MVDVKLTTWVKPSGLEINLNGEAATVAEAERLGWERAEAAPEAKAKAKA